MGEYIFKQHGVEFKFMDTENSTIPCFGWYMGVLSNGSIAMWSMLLVGLMNSIMFATIFTLAIKDLGPLTNKGGSLLNMAIVGGAIVPAIQGLAADSFGLHISFVIPILCYAYIMHYGFIGSKK
jgi:FHS family L-fucose permease-like MFS transporter